MSQLVFSIYKNPEELDSYASKGMELLTRQGKESLLSHSNHPDPWGLAILLPHLLQSFFGVLFFEDLGAGMFVNAFIWTDPYISLFD